MQVIPCNRPGGAGVSPYTFFNFDVRSITVDALGTGVNTAFPLARRMATLELEAEAAVYALSLSSSLINATFQDTIGVFVGLERGEIIDVSGSYALFLTHLARQNSIAGQPAASSRTNTLNFGENSAYKLGSGARLAIYCCSANIADNEISALLSVYWTPAARLGG